MEQDRQGSLEAKQNGSKLAGPNNVTDAKKEDPRADEEAAHDSVSQQTHLDAQASYVNEPRPDEEAAHDSISQQTHLDAQASSVNGTRADEEAAHGSVSQQTHLDAQAFSVNGPRADEEAAHVSVSQQTHRDAQASYVNGPHPDEEAAHDCISQQTHRDAQASYVNEPHPDEEAAHDSVSQQTHLDAHYVNKPLPDEEVVLDSSSQQTHFGAQPHYGDSHCDTEAGNDKEYSRDVDAQCNNVSNREKDSGIHAFKEPHNDEEAGFDHNKSHYDRGWAWVVLATTFLMEFFVGGLITSSGVIYAALIDEFNKSRAATAWVSSLAVSTYYLFSPLGAVISERYGCWVVALLGTLACSIGLLTSSFVTSLPMLYLTYSFVWGMGASLVYFADLLILTKYFKERLAFANGIMALGGAIGGSVLSPTMQQLVIHVGLANMFRFLAGAFFLLSGFALVYRPRRAVCPQNSDVTGDHKEKKCVFDWQILRNKAFAMWITVIFIFMLGYMVPFVHLVRLAEDIGIDKTRASLLLTFVTVGSGCGRVMFGRISDIRRFNRVYIAQIAFLVVGLSNFVIPLTESYTVLAMDAFIFGLFGGCYLIINPVIVCDILGPQKVSYGLGMTFFVIAIPRTLGPLIAGWIYDGLQSYAIAFYSMGATTCLSAILATFVAMLLRKQFEYTVTE